MNIDLTQKEHNTLLQMMEIANWVLFTYSAEDDPDKKNFRDLDQKLLSCDKSFQTEKEVSFDEVETYIDDFETENFFHQLAAQLTTRDLVNQEGLEKLRNMDHTERYDKFEALQKTYLDEFEQNGIDNIQLK